MEVLNQKRASRRGALTLVELLIVIVLITVLVTTAIPVLAPGGDSRKIREASRAVNSFFAGAQSRAIETGRPYGVAIKRLSAVTGDPDDNGVGVELSYVEVPPPYSGLDSGSLVRIGEFVPTPADQLENADENGGRQLKQIRLQFIRYGNTPGDNLPPGFDRDLVPGSFLRPGDLIEIEGMLFSFEEPEAVPGDGLTRVGLIAKGSVEGVEGFFQEVPAGTTTTWAYLLLPFIEEQSIEINLRYGGEGNEISEVADTAAALGPTNASPTTFWSAGVPYKIFRQPVPAQGQPLQLPAGAAIDLAASGFANGLALHRPSDAFRGFTNPGSGIPGEVFTDEVTVMFSPEGSISTARFRPAVNEQNFVPQSEETNVTSSLALMIGRRELIPAEVDAGNNQANIDDPINLSNYAQDFEGDEAQEQFAKYNWLNPDSRWVVIGAQTGSVTTVENAAIQPGDVSNQDAFGLQQQMAVVRGNAPRRFTAGGR